LDGGPFLFFHEDADLDRRGMCVAFGIHRRERKGRGITGAVDSLGKAKTKIESRTVHRETLRTGDSLLVRVGDRGGQADLAGTGIDGLLRQGKNSTGFALGRQGDAALGAENLVVDGAVSKLEFVESAGTGEHAPGVDHPGEL